MTAIIQLDNVSKDFSGFRALDGVSLQISPGVTGLLGPNGAGKSTLIKILLGLLEASSGRGSVLGFELGRQSREIRAAVGYMPEDDCYLPSLSGVECAQFAARLCRFPKIEALRRAHEILDFCGAGEERYRAVETYSTGMRQKLKFAMAIVHDPKLLILDEPTAGLDPDERVAMLNRIKVLAQRNGKSVILCTHILPDVQAVSESVVILARGRVSVTESLETLSAPQSPAIHIRTIGPAGPLREKLRGQGLSVEDGAFEGALKVAGAATVESVWKAAQESGTVLRSMTPARNSLEAIFLDAVRETERADS
jgi:ABC-2 type transport system ATP-binding protein